MSNGWTGGQYSLYRAVFGVYLLIHFVALVPWGPEIFSNTGVLPSADSSPFLYLFPNLLALSDSPATVTATLIAATVASVFFTIGYHDRFAALILWYILSALFGRNPLISNPSLPFVGWLLIAHALLPSAPYGSWRARGRVDPAGDWRMPSAIFAAAWIVMSVGYSYSGYTKLVSPSWVDGTALSRIFDNPLARPGILRDLAASLPTSLLQWMTWGTLALELLYAPLALVRAVRPWIWLAMTGLHIGLMMLIDFADLSFAMIVLHLFTFNPAWIRAARAGTTDLVFYDGSCGLCHRAVRFFLAEDGSGSAFRFAPLGGETFEHNFSAKERDGLPESVVVRTADGATKVESDAALHLLGRLGGVWRVLAGMGRLVPRQIRDAVYGAIALTRYRLFTRATQACPILPPALRERFLP